MNFTGMNYHHTQQFGPPPPSPVSRAFATAATSPGPVQDLGSYINSAANTSADGLGYTATSPQPTGFGHAMAVSHLKTMIMILFPLLTCSFMFKLQSLFHYVSNEFGRISRTV